MNLNEYVFKTEYNKAYDNIADSFYLPCMKCAVKYDRISGYFSSTVFIIAWTELKEFVARGGKIRIICSPFISKTDANALSEGYREKSHQILTDSLVSEIERLFSNPYLEKPARVLSYLVARGVVEVKLAIPKALEDKGIERLFHDKVGIFEDEEGNSVGFRGAMNETYKGLSQDGNLESIDVFPSWEGHRDTDRLSNARSYFNALWNSAVPNVRIYNFPNEAKNLIKKYSNGCDWIKETEEIEHELILIDKWKSDKNRNAKKPRKHQYEALQAWEENGRRGIFKHATGSGKTYTAICAIRNALDKNDVVLVIVPSIELLSQWNDEIKANITDINFSILLCGGGYNSWKNSDTLRTWTQPAIGVPRIILSTVDTAASNDFVSRFSNGEHLLIVADEVHRLGSQKRQNIFNINAAARLGLSATPERYGDRKGTSAIFEYFGSIIPPEFSLPDAIRAGVLTKYIYSPMSVSLNSAEQEEWNRLTKQINRLLGRLYSDEHRATEVLENPQIKKLLIRRSRIVKNASAKIPLAISIIEKNYKLGQRWIIYCDNKNQLREVLNNLLSRHFNAYEFHSEMVGDRKRTLEYFELIGGILVSIKCLDEGVDIPATSHALILASSRNPREFIQRRGRILRNFPGKNMAYLFDAVAIPNKEIEDDYCKSDNLLIGELSRAIQFGTWAENPACIAYLKNIAIDFGIDINEDKEGFEDDENEFE